MYLMSLCDMRTKAKLNFSLNNEELPRPLLTLHDGGIKICPCFVG
jgi:hypothetical protein